MTQTMTEHDRKDAAYQPWRLGVITRKEAGTVYRAYKESTVKVLPETTKLLYQMADNQPAGPLMANEQYLRDQTFFRHAYNAVGFILIGNCELAQDEIDKMQNHLIENAGRKSPFFKYQKSI